MFPQVSAFAEAPQQLPDPAYQSAAGVQSDCLFKRGPPRLRRNSETHEPSSITGSPQNMLIASVSHISYVDFLFHLGPIAFVGLGINWLVLRLMCANDLARQIERRPAFMPMSQPTPRPLGADAARAVPGADRSVWKPVVITAFWRDFCSVSRPPWFRSPGRFFCLSAGKPIPATYTAKWTGACSSSLPGCF